MGIATEDIRRRAIESFINGKGTQDQIARSFNVHIRTFQRWLSRFRKTGETAPRPRGHFPAAFTQQRLAKLDELTDKQPDATLEELVDLSNVDCSIMAVKRALDRLGYRYKKNSPRRRAES